MSPLLLLPLAQTVGRTGLTIALIVLAILVLGFLGWLYGKSRH